MNGDIRYFLKRCDWCQRTNAIFLKSIPVMSKVWHTVSLFYFNIRSEISFN